MANPLPALRRGLELMPSPVPDRPGLLVRDPFRYSEAILIVPPPLVPCLMFFDGVHTELDLREALVRLTGEIEVSELMAHLMRTLGEGGFLEDEAFARLKAVRERDFSESKQREPAHAGSAYPAEPEPLRFQLEQYMEGEAGAATSLAVRDGLLAVAAPHVSPEGGRRSYRAAYAALDPEYASRTFVLLGTSHYGEPERFGLTRKPYLTPLGETAVATEVVDRLAAAGGEAVRMEDYCHAVEHSLEFQVLFLQYLYGPRVRIVPILCGPFARAMGGRGRPEDDPHVARFFEALAEISAAEDGKLLFVLGVDMAHMGRRYGDRFAARADEGRMAGVAERDRARIDRLLAGDADGFWSLVAQKGDDLKWCGSSPLYTFLKTNPRARGELLHYEQWNIDEESVVSFAGLCFRLPEAIDARQRGG